MKRKLTLKKYLYKNLIHDLVSLFIPIIFIFLKKNYEEFYLLFLLRLPKFFENLKNLEELIHLSEKFQFLWDLVKLLLVILYSAHIFGCLTYYIGAYLLNSGNFDGWLVLHNIYDKTIEEKYIESLYFTVLTMITAGSIQTKSKIEKLILTFIVIITTGIFAYSINTVGNILVEINKNENEIKFNNFFIYFFNFFNLITKLKKISFNLIF